MAITQGSSLLSTDMRSWYTRLNTIISNHGGGMAQMTVPSAGKKAEISDVNTVVYKLNDMKADAYLGNDTSLYTTYGAVTAGNLIQPSPGTQLNTVITNLEKIKCRNDATKTNGNTNTVKSHSWSQGAKSNTWNQSANSNGDSYSSKSNGYSQGFDSNGWSQSKDTNGWSNSAKSNGYTVFIITFPTGKEYCSLLIDTP